MVVTKMERGRGSRGLPGWVAGFSGGSGRGFCGGQGEKWLLEEWYGPNDAFFKIRADDGIVYLLRHDTSVADGKWSLVAFNNFKAG